MKIVARCPLYQGIGVIRQKLPFGANPKAPITRADKTGFMTCPDCRGSGSIGIK